jgi:hypothetical protein
MKLTLHIGTHKTGTTALQQFLFANREALIAHGFHYATLPHKVRDANAVANALNVGDMRAVQAFLTNNVALARRRDVGTLLVSAENFYAMSVQDAMQRRQISTNAIERDRVLIEALYSLLPKELTTFQVVCYFRRPDRYAESLYSQHVKRGTIFDGTFPEFLPIMEPALSYSRYIRVWSDVFGKENCNVRLYESVARDIVNDFGSNIMKLDDISQFSHIHGQANERVGRDLLEFKRMRNRTAALNERDIERTILRLVEEKMQIRKAEPDYYQDLLSPSERDELLRLLQPEMGALQASHDVPPFPPFDLDSASANWLPYPGLSQQRRQEIELHYDQINGRVGFRLERLALRCASLLRRSVPVTGVLLDALKEIGAKRALHGLFSGMQRGTG